MAMRGAAMPKSVCKRACDYAGAIDDQVLREPAGDFGERAMHGHGDSARAMVRRASLPHHRRGIPQASAQNSVWPTKLGCDGGDGGFGDRPGHHARCMRRLRASSDRLAKRFIGSRAPSMCGLPGVYCLLARPHRQASCEGSAASDGLCISSTGHSMPNARSCRVAPPRATKNGGKARCHAQAKPENNLRTDPCRIAQRYGKGRNSEGSGHAISYSRSPHRGEDRADSSARGG